MGHAQRLAEGSLSQVVGATVACRYARKRIGFHASLPWRMGSRSRRLQPVIQDLLAQSTAQLERFTQHVQASLVRGFERDADSIS